MFSIGGLEKLEPGARSGRRPAAPNRGARAGGLPPLTRDQTPAKQSCFAIFRIDVLNLLYSIHSSEPPMPPSTEISSRPWEPAARCELSTKMDPRGVCPEPPSSGPPTVLGQRQRSWRPACSRGFFISPCFGTRGPPSSIINLLAGRVVEKNPAPAPTPAKVAPTQPLSPPHTGHRPSLRVEPAPLFLQIIASFSLESFIQLIFPTHMVRCTFIIESSVCKCTFFSVRFWLQSGLFKCRKRIALRCFGCLVRSTAFLN